MIVYLSYKIYKLYLNETNIKNYIDSHYTSKGLQVDKISKLNFTEKIKYGVPIIPMLRMLSYYFGISSNQIDYVRKVELSDNKNDEYTKYVELIIKNKVIISIREFASYYM